MKMPFGKYEGVELSKVPQHYLRWLREQKWLGPWLVQGIDEVLNGGPAGQPEPTVNGFVKQGASDPHKVQSFSVRQSNKVVHAITDPDGSILAWTTNERMAQLMCKLLNQNEELLRKKAEPGS
jgi:hypothetical protein